MREKIRGSLLSILTASLILTACSSGTTSFDDYVEGRSFTKSESGIYSTDSLSYTSKVGNSSDAAAEIAVNLTVNCHNGSKTAGT